MKKFILLLVALILPMSGVVSAAQWPITYHLSGNLSGEYTTGGQSAPFENAPFTLQVTADAVDVVAVTTFFPDDLYVVGAATPWHTGPTINGSLAIEGVGLFTFLNNLYAADTQVDNLQPGIFQIGTDAEYTFIDVTDSFFETYHLMTQVSSLPVVLSTVGFAQFAVSELGGTTGALTLADASSLTFQAEGGVPEPSTFVLLGAGLAGLIAMRRKSRMK
jgi:hypothetical protein